MIIFNQLVLANKCRNIAISIRNKPSFQKCSFDIINLLSRISRIPPIEVNKIPIETKIIDIIDMLFIFIIKIIKII